MYFYVLLLIKM